MIEQPLCPRPGTVTEVICIKKKKELRFLRQTASSGPDRTVPFKEQLAGQDYLIVTLIEGTEDMEQGLRQIIRNHIDSE